jgi:hypothetical protein
MTALAEVFVTVRPDTDKFGPEVKSKLAKIDAKKEGNQVATRFGVGFNGAFGGIISRSAGLFAAGFAAVKGVQIFGGFIKDAAESEKISRITANAIRATGGAAKISAQQVSDLSTAISNKTAIDDEQIQTAANMLLTFKNIRNETGKGNDIFNQATQAAADLGVQFGGIDTASKQLGKALNDPIKGITALAKSGVTFTEQQKEQIKTLTKSGDVLGAQKIILKEINAQVGGAAAAAADPMERLKVVAGNLGEEVGGLLLPHVNRFFTFITDKGIPAIRSLIDLVVKGDFTSQFRKSFNLEEDSGFVGFLLNARATAITVFKEITGGVRAFAASWKANDGDITSSGFPGLMERLGFTARRTFDFFRTEVLPRLRDFGGFVVGTAIPAVTRLASNLMTTLSPAVSAVFGFFKAEIIPRLREFAGFVTGSVVPTVGRLTEALSKDKDILVPLVGALAGGIVVFKAITIGIKAWAVAQAALNVVLTANPIGLVIVAVAALVAGIVIAYKKSETFRNVVNKAFASVKTTVTAFAPLVKAVFDTVAAVISGWWELVGKRLLAAFILVLQTGWKQAQTFGRIVAATFGAIKEPARVALKFVIDKFLGFVETILTGAGKAFGWVPGMGDKLKTAAGEFRTFRDNVNKALDGVQDEPVNVKVGMQYESIIRKQTGGSGGRAPGTFARGGGVYGAGTATSDSIPAWLSNGEHVWTAREVSAAGGHRAMEQMRKSVVGFASGGGVDLRAILPSASRVGGVAAAISRTVDQVGTAVAKSIAKGMVAGRINPGLAGALRWARTQDPLPYLWGGMGRGGWDCSGFMSGITNHILGRSVGRRLFTTGSFPTGLFAQGMGAFSIGSVRGNPGHMAGTLNGVNVESRGGDGVVIGRGARGAKDRLFRGNIWHLKGFAKGGAVGDPAFDLLDPRGKAYNKQALLKALGVGVYDGGGKWPSGTLGYNGTGKNETVRTAEQEAALRRPLIVENHIEIGGEVVRVVRTEIDATAEFVGTTGRMR